MLTVGKWHAAAYLREARAMFSFKASEMYLAPSAPMLLAYRLRARTERTRQGVLTVGRRASGSVLELCEGLILFQALRQVLGGLSIQFIVHQTASMKQNPTSGGAGSREGR